LRIELSRSAQKDLMKVPDYIGQKLAKWVKAVTDQGLQNVRKIPGWHDEPLKGDRQGQRSIRLSGAYRAIYREHEVSGVLELIEIQEINKHKY